MIRTVDGAVIDGLIVRETAAALFILAHDGSERRVARSSVEALRESRISLMPKGLDRALGISDLRDLIAYLASLR